MPRFFREDIGGAGAGDCICVTGADARHIALSLRMKAGEALTVCDGAGTDYSCVIRSVTPDEVLLGVVEKTVSVSEPSLKVTLYQGYPKGDKLETVIEKSVELGVSEVVPVLTARSVARPDPKAAAKKLERWRRRAAEAAKQCGRGIIPAVSELTAFDGIERRIREHQLAVYFYEAGGSPLRELISRAESANGGKLRDIGIFIGPEGGIALPETGSLESWGAVPATLGRRILRTETAPIAALAAIMLLTGNLE